MRSASPGLVNCPHCLAGNPAEEDRCRACGQPLTLYIGPPERIPRRFGLGSLMLLIALIAVCLVVVRESLPLGVVLFVLVVPALFRTIQWSAQRAANGRPMGLVERLAAFYVSVALAWVLLVVGGIAFVAGSIVGSFLLFPVVSLFVTEQPLGPPPVLFLVPGLVAGASGAGATIYYLGRVLWTVKNDDVYFA